MSKIISSLYVKSALFFIIILSYIDGQAGERFRIEAKSTQISVHSSVKIVDDIDASSGKAIEIPQDIPCSENVLSFSIPADIIPGRYRVILRLKAEDIYDIGKALRIEVREGNILKSYAVAYGLYLKGNNDYQDFGLEVELRDNSKKYVVLARWTVGGEAHISGYRGEPKIRIDTFDIVRTGDIPLVDIIDVFPDRIRYLVNQDGEVTVIVKNFSKEHQECEVKMNITHDLEEQKLLGNQIIKLSAGESKQVKFHLKHGGGLFGYAVRAVLFQNGKIVDEFEEYFTVHNNHWAVATGLGCGVRDDEQSGGLTNGTWHGPFSGIGSTDAEIQRLTGLSRVEKDYTTCMELGRMPGESSYMAPKEPIWIDPQAVVLESVHEMQKAVDGLKRYGIGCHVYLADLPIGTPAIKLIKEHPEWFVYSSETGDFEQWYNTYEVKRHNEFWKNFDWTKFNLIANPESSTWKGTGGEWANYQNYTRSLADEVRKLSCVGFFMFNYKLPEVVDYVADQIIASTKMFGWDGIRWDCGNLETSWVYGSWKPYIDFYGKPLAETPEEMVEQTVANLKRLKARVRKEFPNFVFGTNWGSKEETHMYPKLAEELCRDGGWMLNEVSNWYDSPTSPYHFWDKYYDIMTYQGEYVTNFGGHYDPFSGAWVYPADRLYGSIFMLSGKGHPHILWHNSRTPAGNFPQFCVRFGRFVFDPNLRLVNNPEEIIKVEPENLWWNKSVQRLKLDKKEFLIVHLINPPVTSEIGTNQINRLPEPINNTTITVRVPKGKSKVQSWVLTAESWKLGDLPKTQAISLKASIEKSEVTVTVPEILYWKVLVFKFE